MFTSHHNWKEKRHNTNFFIQLGLALIVHRLPACPNQWSLKTLIFLHCAPHTFMWMLSSWSGESPPVEIWVGWMNYFVCFWSHLLLHCNSRFVSCCLFLCEPSLFNLYLIFISNCKSFFRIFYLFKSNGKKVRINFILNRRSFFRIFVCLFVFVFEFVGFLGAVRLRGYCLFWSEKQKGLTCSI